YKSKELTRMSGIGCELISHGGYSVLPDHSFSMKVLWNSIGIPSSTGKDVYHESGLILSNKRIAATGRIHHLSKDTTNWFEPLQTKPASLIEPPDDEPLDLKVEVIVPPINASLSIDRTGFL